MYSTAFTSLPLPDLSGFSVTLYLLLWHFNSSATVLVSVGFSLPCLPYTRALQPPFNPHLSHTQSLQLLFLMVLQMRCWKVIAGTGHPDSCFLWASVCQIGSDGGLVGWCYRVWESDTTPLLPQTEMWLTCYEQSENSLLSSFFYDI